MKCAVTLFFVSLSLAGDPYLSAQTNVVSGPDDALDGQCAVVSTVEAGGGSSSSQKIVGSGGETVDDTATAGGGREDSFFKRLIAACRSDWSPATAAAAPGPTRRGSAGPLDSPAYPSSEILGTSDQLRHWIGSTMLLRPELRLEHSYNRAAYDLGTKKTHFVVAGDFTYHF